MPFDYNSFMVGVVTGLKLHRPQSPTPAQRNDHMIPERDEDRMVTESGNLKENYEPE